MAESLGPDGRVGVREVGRLAWPIVVSMMSYTAMATADSIMVAWLGTGPLAAVGLAAIIGWVWVAFGMGLMEGLRVQVAQATGAGQREVARRLLWQGLWAAALLGAAGVALAPLGPSIFDLLGASPEVAELGDAYLRVRWLGSLAVFALFAACSWFQGRGDTRTPMVAQVGANLLNIALDLLLIFGAGPIPALGVAGAALATMISWGLGALWLLWRARQVLSITRVAPELALLRRLVDLGAPLALRAVLEVGAFAVFGGALARAGDAHMAAHVVAIRLVSVSFLAGHGIAQACSVVVGQAVGARRPELARQALTAALRLAVPVMGLIGLIFVFAPDLLLLLFDPEPLVAEIARDLMRIAAAFQVVDAVAMVAQQALNGAGETRFVLVSTALASWLIMAPVSWIFALPLGWGAQGAWWGLTIYIAVLAAISLQRTRGKRWLASAAGAEPEVGLAPARAA